MDTQDYDAILCFILDRLINEGSPMGAVQQGVKYVDDNPTCDNAHVWLQLARACYLCDMRIAESYANRAKECSNYTDALHSDYLLATSLGVAERGDAKVAARLLRQADKLGRDDDGRAAAVNMVRGQLKLLQGDPEQAIDWLRLADALYEGDDEERWVRNNRFHTLRAHAAARKRGTASTRRTERRNLYKEIARNRPGRRLRFRAWLLYRFGCFGYVVDRRLFVSSFQ